MSKMSEKGTGLIESVESEVRDGFHCVNNSGRNKELKQNDTEMILSDVLI